MVGGRRRCHGRIAGEGDQADLQAVGHLFQERPHRLGRRADPRRLHVLRLHRARDVDDEDHGRPVLRDEGRALRARHSDAESGQCQQEQDERHVLAPDPSAHHAGEHLHVREADRVPHASPLGEHPEGDRERDEHQRQQQERALEGHEPPPQTAPTCTIARTPLAATPARTRTSTRFPRDACAADTLRTSVAVGAPVV